MSSASDLNASEEAPSAEPWFRRPHPSDSSRVRVEHTGLRRSVSDMLAHAGLSQERANTAADVVVSADLRGISSHGVSNMLPIYLKWMADGTVDAAAEPVVVRSAPSVTMFDGRRSLGVATAPMAMEYAIAKAAETGFAMSSMSNGTHLGMAGYHAMLALPHSAIGICTTSTATPSAHPTYSAKPALGTNPIAFAAPADSEHPFVFDAATTVVAGNRIASARRDGRQVPPGVLADADGAPYGHPVDAPEDWRALLMLGSTPELSSHKGYGLSMIVETLGRVLACQSIVEGFGRGTANHFFAVISLESISDPGVFTSAMDDLIREMNNLPSNAPGQSVLVAGQRASRTAIDYAQHGIPMQPAVYEWIIDQCRTIGVPTPERLG